MRQTITHLLNSHIFTYFCSRAGSRQGLEDREREREKKGEKRGKEGEKENADETEPHEFFTHWAFLSEGVNAPFPQPNMNILLSCVIVKYLIFLEQKHLSTGTLSGTQLQKHSAGPVRGDMTSTVTPS